MSKLCLNAQQIIFRENKKIPARVSGRETERETEKEKCIHNSHSRFSTFDYENIHNFRRWKVQLKKNGEWTHFQNVHQLCEIVKWTKFTKLGHKTFQIHQNPYPIVSISPDCANRVSCACMYVCVTKKSLNGFSPFAQPFYSWYIPNCAQMHIAHLRHTMQNMI